MTDLHGMHCLGRELAQSVPQPDRIQGDLAIVQAHLREALRVLRQLEFPSAAGRLHLQLLVTGVKALTVLEGSGEGFAQLGEK